MEAEVEVYEHQPENPKKPKAGRADISATRHTALYDLLILSVSPMSVMNTAKHPEGENTAPVGRHHSSRQPPLEKGTENGEQHRTPFPVLNSSAVPISEQDLLDEAQPHKNESTPEDTALHQPSSPEVTADLHAVANILPSAIFTDTREQSSQRSLLKSKTQLSLGFPPAFTQRFRYFPRIFIASSL